MKKFLKFFCALGIAALSFAACEEEVPVEDLVNYVFSGNTSFIDYKATIKVVADKAAPEDVDLEIVFDAASTLKPEMLKFPSSIKIAKGDKEASAVLEILDPMGLKPGTYKAIIGVSLPAKGLIGENITITFTRPDLNGKWSVIGLGGKWGDNDDIAMTEGQDGWYVAEGVEIEAGEVFKFRKDGKWDLSYGLSADGNAPLDQEFAVDSTPGSKNIGIADEGVYTLSVNPNAAKAKVVRTGDIIRILTLADLVALMPAENNAEAAFKCVLNDIVVTYVSGSNVFFEDATAAMLLYKANSGLQAGVKLSGLFEGKVKNFKGLPEISEINYNQEEITIGQGVIPEAQEMTIAQVLANFDKLISKRVKLTNVYAGDDIQKKGEYNIYQGEDNMIFYTNVNLEKGFRAGSLFDVTAIVTPYNDKKQVKIFEEAAITRLIPLIEMKDIQALCTSSTSESFAGVIKGFYVNYIFSTDHIYLEDESGALRYYKSGGGGLKVGDKLSGVITGTCLKGSGDGRPYINYIDMKYVTVEAAPAEEQPKPVTGTLASFTDAAGLMYRRVYLEDVVLEDNVTKSGVVTISDATGTFPLNVRFTPSQAVPKGYKISFTGTFDVDSKGNLEIRVFKQSEVTKIAAPTE